MKGQLRWWLVDVTRPKEPRIPLGDRDDEISDVELEFLERTCIRNWMSLWLRSLKDHTVLSSNMETPLTEFLKLVVVEHPPYRRTYEMPKIKGTRRRIDKDEESITFFLFEDIEIVNEKESVTRMD